MKYLAIILFTIIGFAACSQVTSHNPKSKEINHSNKTPYLLTEAEWKKKLSPEQYYVLREKGTERAFTGKLLKNKEKGTYVCAGCGTALFTDDMKFESRCGWPSFDKEVAGNKIIQTEDHSHGMIRTEITCANCGGHLGHIFDDGPTNTGKRYCVNSLSLDFKAAGEKIEALPEIHNKQVEMITLAGGCFWCIEAIFEALEGVSKVESGYSGGEIKNPSYKEISKGNTRHAEVVQISFDPSVISVEELLEVFFTLHDPTTLNRQGADVGPQYRSAIFYHTSAQKTIAENIINVLNQEKVFKNPIVTEISPFGEFYIAEDYHQEYYAINKEQPYCKAVIKPKMDKLYKVFKDKLKKQ